MTRPRWPHMIFLTAVLAIALVCLAAWQRTKEPVLDSRVRQIYLAVDPYESSDGSQFWIRVTEQPETGSASFVAGSFYSFDSGSSQAGPWTNVMTVHLDDPDPIPTGNVAFVDRKVGYVFLKDKLAVTTDVGLSWSVWELGQYNPELRPKRAAIRTVTLSADGTGTMVVNVFASGTDITLHTRNFGKNWIQ